MSWVLFETNEFILNLEGKYYVTLNLQYLFKSSKSDYGNPL